MTPDGTTYDLHSILRWIGRCGTDPRTRLPLSPDMLRPNRHAGVVLSLFQKTFPELQATLSQSESPAKAQDLGKELFDAIVTNKPKRAMEILAGPIDDDVLNMEYKLQHQSGSLLFWALDCYAMSDVAVALIRQCNFRALFFPTPHRISHLQYAAALGFTDVCRELLKRQPLRMALAPIFENITIFFRNGEQLRILPKTTAMALARQRGHTEIFELFNRAIIYGRPELP